MKQAWKSSRQIRSNPYPPAGPHEARLSGVELETALRSVEPAARLAPPRLMRRVVRADASLHGFGFRVPHSKTYVIQSVALLEIADRDELGISSADILSVEVLPPSVILLERPSAVDLDGQPRDELLLHYWELLFHARVHQSFDQLKALGRFGAEEVEQRLAGLSPQEFDEIRTVLQQERFLLPPYDDASVYIEFAAVYLGMRHFQPSLLASFFPALRSLDEIDRLIALDIDAPSLLAATRLPGAPEGSRHTLCAIRPKLPASEDPCDDDLPLATPGGRHSESACYYVRIPAGQRSEKKYLNWSQRAAHHAARGNFAGAVIRRARAEAWVPREKAAEAATALRDAVHHFVERLQAALGTEGEDPRFWRESLLALAHQTPRGLWTVEARLLYDLQRACIDQERPTSTVDVMSWILSLGRRAIRRDLPDQRRVAMSRHLRSAERRLSRVRISDRQRRQLTTVLDAATKAAEADLREGLRPKIVAALDDIDLKPQNLPEVIARKKIVEELLDRIMERGFLTLGEVRDAISRNQLKEPDCSGPKSFLRGEAALRANRRLTDALDGVYQPGDFYCRWILRFSHIMFGTAVGRFLTLYLVVPLGGAAVAAMGLDHFIELIFRFHPHLAPKPEEWPETLHAIGSGRFPFALAPVFLLAISIGLLVNLAGFRDAVWRGLKWVGGTINTIVFPCFDMLFRSAFVRLIAYLLIRPIVPTLILAAMFLRIVPREHRFIGLACIYVGVMVAINSRVGRDLEELAWDTTAEGWQRFGWRPLVGMFWFIIDVFRRFLQVIERVLYTVDEWLRFRSGQSRAVLVAKGALGVFWFFVAYIVRIFVNLLIEPQLNPLKHIPWVSVSHKIMLPIWGQMHLPELLGHYMNSFLAWLLAGVIVTGTPGIFGFLIWELMENWRLFAANRTKNLRAVRIGSHGETMARLLRPGIHSGTIPKRFAKLRRAERKALRGGDPGAARKHREILHHVEVDLHRYIEREFVAWFDECHDWTGARPKIGPIHLATNAASMHIEIPEAAEGPLTMSFRLVAGGVQLDLSGRLCPEQLSVPADHVLRLTLINLLKTAGVDVLTQPQSNVTENASNRQIVDQIAVPWAEWVAAWESQGMATKIPCDVISPRSD